jgi:hypothetical protein
MSTCAPFVEERRMKIGEPTRFHRNSGIWATLYFGLLGPEVFLLFWCAWSCTFLLLAQCSRETDQAFANGSFIVAGEAEKQCLRVGALKGVSINGKNFDALACGQLFCMP